jgi:hypothetical protein
MRVEMGQRYDFGLSHSSTTKNESSDAIQYPASDTQIILFAPDSQMATTLRVKNGGIC